jgi:hypothetical protein
LFTSIEASADSMNPALSRFVLDHRCHAVGVGGGSHAAYLQGGAQNAGAFNDNEANLTALNSGSTGRRWCTADDAMFKRLINQWGFALAPSAMHSARTTGFGGFHFSFEGMYTKIDSDADYWKLGTRGPRDPSSDRASIFNESPADMIQLYSVKVRKSFGFGLELTTAVGFVPATTLISGGADVRMSLLEGFRTGFLGILPDIAVGGGVRTITGTPEFQLTTVGLDVQVSKPLAIASQSVITPYIGYQYLWIFGDSGLIDTTPATDPVGYCNFTGPNVPGNPDTFREEKTPGTDGTPNNQIYDGQPVCAGSGSPIDFNNNVVFDNVRLERQRGIIGLNYRFEMVMVGGQFIVDLVDPADAQVGDDAITLPTGEQLSDEEVLRRADVPRQWSLVFEVGAMF